jgi:hypothetical protein
MSRENRSRMLLNALVALLAIGMGTLLSQPVFPQGGGFSISLGPVLESGELRELLFRGISDSEREHARGLVFGVSRGSEFVRGYGVQLVGEDVAGANVLTKIEFDDYYSVVLLSAKDEGGDRRILDIVGSSWGVEGQQVENPWVLIDGEEVQDMYAVVEYGTARTPRIHKIYTVDLVDQKIVELDFNPEAIELLPEE